MHVVVVGVGAVGIALASFLEQAGASLSVVARGALAAQIREGGIGRSGIFGAHDVPPHALRVEETLDALSESPIDWLCICTKTTSSRSIAADLAHCEPLWATPPRVLVLHNGWGSADVFASAIPPARVYSARVITGFRRTSPTHSEITVHAAPVLLGSLFGADTDGLEPLASALSRAGLPTQISRDISRDLWAKLIYNCALNPLGALRNASYGELANDPDTRHILERIVHEVFAVMHATGRMTHWSDAEHYLRDFYTTILPPTAQHESSMLQDLRAGRKTEIDALSGAVVRLANAHGVSVPVNAALHHLVGAIENAADGPADD